MPVCVTGKWLLLAKHKKLTKECNWINIFSLASYSYTNNFKSGRTYFLFSLWIFFFSGNSQIRLPRSTDQWVNKYTADSNFWSLRGFSLCSEAHEQMARNGQEDAANTLSVCKFRMYNSREKYVKFLTFPFSATIWIAEAEHIRRGEQQRLPNSLSLNMEFCYDQN